ncbi:hypothetical protein [Litoribacter populi]|uniref:hypothetical protein n=1 Tax=Litoribacter populi TaxID=2598460 RepID=UPI001C8F796A|nr:hypothetical protein [Litoribacter populi]
MVKNKYIKKPHKAIKNGFSASFQLKKIKESFPNLIKEKVKGNSFSISLKIQPTPFSKSYNIRIQYDKFLGVKVYVIGEDLEIAENRSKLPHVYSHEKQELCLYSPGKNEWTREKLIVATIIPWASEWLFFYELWLTNGEWLGGGHDEYSNEQIK